MGNDIKSARGRELAMKPKHDLDPDFAAPSSRRHALAWLLGLFSIFALVASLTLLSSTVALTAPHRVLAQGAGSVTKAAKPKIRQRVSAAPIRVMTRQPGDHFVVIASPTIDPEMVRRAPAAIDEGIVVRPRDAQPALPPTVGPNGAVPPGYFEAPGGTTVPGRQFGR
jgi:hypothetical protein